MAGVTFDWKGEVCVVTGGGSGTVTGGGVQGPLATLTGGTAGTATITAKHIVIFRITNISNKPFGFLMKTQWFH